MQDFYFVGQYAAPVTCLDDMKELKIAGMTALTMESEADYPQKTTDIIP
jgi:hypothetical protein